MYQTSTGLKMCEEDSFEHGCLPETAFHVDIDVYFKSETPEGLLDEIKSFYGVDEDAIMLNACDEMGRVDIAVMEDADSVQASDAEIEEWKKGNKRLYYSVYTHKAYKCTELSL